MENFTKIAYLDIFSGDFLYIDFFDTENNSKYILIPKFDDMEISRAYLSQLNDRKLKNQLLNKLQDAQFGQIFHTAINNNCLYNDFISFSRNMMINIAKEWCDKNNIKCTFKHKFES